MNCPYCGETIEDDSRFCMNCGRPVFRPGAPVHEGQQPYYGRLEYASKPPEKPVPKKWLPTPGVTLLIAFLLMAAEVLVTLLYYRKMGYHPERTEAILSYLAVPALLLLDAILFLCPTRRAPIVCAIPRLLRWLAGLASVVMVYFVYHSSIRLDNLLIMGVTAIAVLIFFIALAARTKGYGMFVIHLLLTILLFAGTIAKIFLFGAGGKLGIATTILSALSALFAGIGYTAAILDVGKRG